MSEHSVFTYEALVIEANRDRVPNGQEPITVVYPQGSLAAHEALCRHVVEGNAEAAQRAALALIEHASKDMQDCFENESGAETS